MRNDAYVKDSESEESEEEGMEVSDVSLCITESTEIIVHCTYYYTVMHCM